MTMSEEPPTSDNDVRATIAAARTGDVVALRGLIERRPALANGVPRR